MNAYIDAARIAAMSANNAKTRRAAEAALRAVARGKARR